MAIMNLTARSGQARGSLALLTATIAIWSGIVSAPAYAAAAASPILTAHQEAATSGLPACLLGRWTHSHEEDALEIRVYRPADYPFPPSRGRTGFAFLAGGGLIVYGIAPADGVVETGGQWAFIPPNYVSIALDGELTATESLEVVSCSEDRLEIAAP